MPMVKPSEVKHIRTSSNMYTCRKSSPN